MIKPDMRPDWIAGQAEGLEPLPGKGLFLARFTIGLRTQWP